MCVVCVCMNVCVCEGEWVSKVEGEGEALLYYLSSKKKKKKRKKETFFLQLFCGHQLICLCLSLSLTYTHTAASLTHKISPCLPLSCALTHACTHHIHACMHTHICTHTHAGPWTHTMIKKIHSARKANILWPLQVCRPQLWQKDAAHYLWHFLCWKSSRDLSAPQRISQRSFKYLPIKKKVWCTVCSTSNESCSSEGRTVQVNEETLNAVQRAVSFSYKPYVVGVAEPVLFWDSYGKKIQVWAHQRGTSRWHLRENWVYGHPWGTRVSLKMMHGEG